MVNKQRPPVPVEQFDEKEHRRRLADSINAAMPKPSSFTPVLKFGGDDTGIQYSTQTGESLYYGDFAYEAWIRIVLTNKGSSTGVATIEGLEETNDIGIKSVSADLTLDNISGANKSDVRMRVEANDDVIKLAHGQGGSTGTGTDFDEGDFTNTTEITGRISYRL